MKKCFKCNEEKPLSDFYKHAQMADGHLNKCKVCTKKDAHQLRHESDSREKILAYDRARGNRHSASYLKDYREKYPNKYKAHQTVNYAIRSKKLFRESCEVCGVDETHGHHDDYLKPLNVRWLCAEHHHQWHAKHGEALNAC
jgi:hypothetical protein